MFTTRRKAGSGHRARWAAWRQMMDLLHNFHSFQCSCLLGCQPILPTSMMWDPHLAVAMSNLSQFSESLLTFSSRNAYTGYPLKQKLRGRNQLCAFLVRSTKYMPFIFPSKIFSPPHYTNVQINSLFFI